MGTSRTGTEGLVFLPRKKKQLGLFELWKHLIFFERIVESEKSWVTEKILDIDIQIYTPEMYDGYPTILISERSVLNLWDALSYWMDCISFLYSFFVPKTASMFIQPLASSCRNAETISDKNQYQTKIAITMQSIKNQTSQNNEDSIYKSKQQCVNPWFRPQWYEILQHLLLFQCSHDHTHNVQNYAWSGPGEYRVLRGGGGEAGSETNKNTSSEGNVDETWCLSMLIQIFHRIHVWYIHLHFVDFYGTCS